MIQVLLDSQASECAGCDCAGRSAQQQAQAQQAYFEPLPDAEFGLDLEEIDGRSPPLRLSDA